jgi:hypothetical protein
MSFPDSLTNPQATKSRSDDIINLNQPLFFVLYALFFGAAQQRLLAKSQSDDIINLNQTLFFVLYALFFGAAQQRLTHKKWATEPATHLNVTDY